MKKYTTKNIDRYIQNEMPPSKKQQWDKERKSDKKLDREIKLYQEIEEALREKDIISLRIALLRIIKTGYSPLKKKIHNLSEPSQITVMS